MSQNRTRDELFKAFFKRDLSPEERERFDWMGNTINLHLDDPMWYVILVNELYDDRLENRFKKIDEISSRAADMALEKISEVIAAKVEEAAVAKAKANAAKENSLLWQSWGFIMSFIVLFGACCTSAGYVMGMGKIPFWLDSSVDPTRGIAGYFLNVPSGWIFLLASTPFLVSRFKTTLGYARIAHDKAKIKPYLQAAGCLLMLLLNTCIVFAFF